MEITDFF